MQRDPQQVSPTVACPSCGKPVDALRAGHVAILDGAFRYFCDEACKRAFVLRSSGPPPSQVETAEPPPVAARPPLPLVPEPAPAAAPAPPRRFSAATAVEPRSERAAPPPALLVHAGVPVPSTSRDSSPPGLPSPFRAYLPAVVSITGVFAGCLAPGLGLLGPSAQSARFGLATLALLACALRAAIVLRDPSDVHPLAAVLWVAAVWGVALYARHGGDVRALRLASVAGLAAAVHLLSALLVDRAREGVRSARSWIRERLDVPVRVVRGDETVTVPANDARPGEEIVAVAGDTVGVDARVTAGEAIVTPWVDATIEMPKKEGIPLVAGARVVSGSLRAVTTWSGSERAWLKLADSPSLRPDVVGPLVRWVRLGIERGAIPAAGGVAARPSPTARRASTGSRWAP